VVFIYELNVFALCPEMPQKTIITPQTNTYNSIHIGGQLRSVYPVGLSGLGLSFCTIEEREREKERDGRLGISVELSEAVGFR